MDTKAYDDALLRIRNEIYAKNFSPYYIVYHKEPDGDAIGSSVALYRALLKMGVDVKIIHDEPIPYQYSFLTYDIQIDDRVFDAGVFIFLDFSEKSKLPNFMKHNWELINDKITDFIVINHDKKYDLFKENDNRKIEVILNPFISSTGEAIYELINLLGVEIDNQIGQALYTAIISDTRSFKYTRTTPRSLQIAAELTERVDNEAIHRRVFSVASLDEIHALGVFLKNSKTSPYGKVVYSVMTYDIMQQYNVDRKKTKGFVNNLLEVLTAEIAVFFREDKKGEYKVSIRAKGRYNLEEVLKDYEGAIVKPFAASFKYFGNIDNLITKLVHDLEVLVLKHIF